MTDSPTLSMYSALQRAFDHFNEQLLDNELPLCLITLRSSRRQRGYHYPERFISRDGTIIHELGVHPGYFTLNPLEVALSTLVHEMVHHWQECNAARKRMRERGHPSFRSDPATPMRRARSRASPTDCHGLCEASQ